MTLDSGSDDDDDDDDDSWEDNMDPITFLLDTMRLALRSVAKIVQEHDQKMRHLNQSRRKWCIIEGVVG